MKLSVECFPGSCRALGLIPSSKKEGWRHGSSGRALASINPEFRCQYHQKKKKK
jgi:hypothetical protein